jgi:hypothetical protein
MMEQQTLPSSAPPWGGFPHLVKGANRITTTPGRVSAHGVFSAALLAGEGGKRYRDALGFRPAWLELWAAAMGFPTHASCDVEKNVQKRAVHDKANSASTQVETWQSLTSNCLEEDTFFQGMESVISNQEKASSVFLITDY